MSHSSYRSTTTTSGRSSIGTQEYPNFHGNTQSYFDLTGNSHVVHSLDVEMDSSNWNPRGHSVDVLYPSGLQGGTRITVDLHTYEAVWSGEQVKPLFILSSVLYFNSQVLVRYVTTQEERSRRGRGGAVISTEWETKAVTRCRTKFSSSGQVVGADNIELGPH